MKSVRESEFIIEELTHIPDGPSHPQHLFRLIYGIHRMHSLYEGTKGETRRKALIETCSRIVREFYIDFTPRYDEAYFELANSK